MPGRANRGTDEDTAIMSATREGRRRKLPTGIQTFREIREDDCYYVDKTAFIRRLVDEGKHYFLSRPRRFGKSLFLDTVKELFEGSEALFEGLDVHAGWDWSVRHPVLRLDFSAGHFTEPDGLHYAVMDQLQALGEETGIRSDLTSAPARFRHLIATLRERTGQRVVVLVDDGPVEAKGLRRQAPQPGPARASGGGGVQPGDPQPGVVRGRAGLMVSPAPLVLPAPGAKFRRAIRGHRRSGRPWEIVACRSDHRHRAGAINRSRFRQWSVWAAGLRLSAGPRRRRAAAPCGAPPPQGS